MASALTVPEQIKQLNDARKLVLGDVKYYPSVVKGILPIIGPTAPIEVRRWGADFLAEAFATPTLPNGEKETMQPYVLPTLESIVTNERDNQVLRSVIQAAASIYPLAMRWTINNGYDTTTWNNMVSIKQRILDIWEQAPPTVRICCIKFAQRVVLAQSVASGAEPRYGALDVSLDKISETHQTLDPQTLQAEGMGLLDRMLSVFHGSSDALIVDATLNCLSILVRTRPGTSNRILNTLLTFDPLKTSSVPLTPKTKVMIKSMGKTTRLLLIHLSKRDPHNPMVPRIHQHVERMMRMIAEALDETSRKRALEAQQQDGIDAKRQRTDITQVQIPPLGPGPHTLADVFSLTTTAGLKSFDLSQLPAPLIAKMAVNTLSRIDAQLLNKAITAVRERLDTIASAATQEINPNTAPLGVDEDEDDDYEPDFFQAEDTEQILNKLDIDPKSSVGMISRAEDALGQNSLNLPEPQALTPEMALSAGNGIVARVMEAMRTLDEHSAKKSKSGFKRFAASSGLRDSWVTILARLAMRPSVAEQITVKGEEAAPSKSLRDHIRDVLFNYIMEDFRKHIDMAVSWLCEEWFNDRIQEKRFANEIQGESGEEQPARCEKHYEKCALRLIDGFLPYLHPQDKILTRFLSEIPELNQTILSRVKDMCKDPSVVQLALTSLLYLVMMRPPAKEIALDTVFNIWEDYQDARPLAGKYLSKYRPDFLEKANRKVEAADTTQKNTTAIAA